MKIIPPFLAVFALFALGGCASLFKGTHEKLTVRTTPAGAICNVYREQEGLLKVIVTPGAAYIRRDKDPLTIVCNKEGYEETSATLAPDQDIFAGADGREEPFANLGFPLDVANSSIYDLPNEANLTLRKK